MIDALIADRSFLSTREAQVLGHLARGLTCQQTANRMGLAVHTVDTYLRRIKSKSGINTKAELTRLAVTLSL